MQKLQSSFVALISVFFFWGFVAASNGILIPLFLLAGALGTKLASLSKAAPAGPWERPNNIPLRQYPYSLHVGSV